MGKVVLHIHDLGLGGAERIALKWIAWLQDMGHEVTLLLGYPPEGCFTPYWIKSVDLEVAANLFIYTST